MTAVTKTLEAKLVNPTTHKERKLRELASTYRKALRHAFDAGADTMGAVNEIVTPYDLPYQVKDALKSYVPTLFSTYGANDLRENHPVRFVNRAANFDHDETREYGFCWEVPRPGRGTNIWIPLAINPDHEELWHDLLAGQASPGELRLQYRNETWMLHVTVKFPNEESSERDDIRERTTIGVDIGESALITGCALAAGSPINPVIVNGNRAKQLRKEMFSTLNRLQRRESTDLRIEELLNRFQNALTDIIEKASRTCVEYARQFEHPLIVLEDLSFIRDRMDMGAFMNRRLHGWAFSRLQRRIEDKATEAQIPVKYVSPAYTFQTGHSCNHLGTRPNQSEFRCNNRDCWVTTYQADVNAAANLAQRVYPWGESCRLKPGANDSPRDGSPCGGATTHPGSVNPRHINTRE